MAGLEGQEGKRTQPECIECLAREFLSAYLLACGLQEAVFRATEKALFP